jgi:hypothetical protein
MACGFMQVNFIFHDSHIEEKNPGIACIRA